VRRFESEMMRIRVDLPQIAPAQNTLIVGFDSHFLGYRHAGYYLPSYLTLQYPKVKLMEGTRIFAMRGRDTRLLPELPVTSFSRFVLFPLPNGDSESRDYLRKVEEKLPGGNLRTI